MSSDTDYDAALSRWFSGKTEAPDDSDSLMSPAANNAAQLEAIERVQGWVRARFRLQPDAAILVSEVACKLPGCPPLETVVAFWENEQRHHFKLFKPVADVTLDNLPFAWMKETLIVPEGFGCECC